MTGDKLVLLGTQQQTGQRVVIKYSKQPAGQAEIEHERRCRQTLQQIPFAYRQFVFAKELAFVDGDTQLLVSEFIAQPQPFFEQTLAEQFFLSLRTLETQEAFHLVSASHRAMTQDVFGVVTTEQYQQLFDFFVQVIDHHGLTEQTAGCLTAAKKLLQESAAAMDIYGQFLTHADFIPNNVRTADHVLYLLDQTSLHFGNKYESWARWINYMTLYQPELEQALVQYVRDNRSSQEQQSLQAMRVYKLGYLLAFYAATGTAGSGSQAQLASERFGFWVQVLQAVLAGEMVERAVVEEYKKTRDQLRSEAEVERQKSMLR